MSDGPGRAGRQTLLVALCVLGLVVGATALGPGAESSGAFPDGGEIDLSDLLQLFVDDEQRRSACDVTLLGPPVPGETVTVAVVSATGPVEGADVWLNDRRIGRTNVTGRVAGTVPYERPIEIRARVPDGVSCSAAGDASFDRGGLSNDRPAADASGLAEAEPVAAAEQNVTRTITTDGRIDITVTERPFPGEEVTVLARIRGRPVPAATVTVDGDRVGETDAAGAYELSVPDDGREQVRVAVERGDYSGRVAIPVAVLDAAVSPRTLVALPGQPATVNVTLGAETVSGATVTVDGRRIGETGPNGQLRLTLPTDPTATLRVAAVDQTATVSLARLYAGTVALVGLVLAALGAVTVTAVRRVRAPSGTPAPGAVASRVRRLLNRLVRRALGVATWLTGLFDDAEARLRALWRTLATSPATVVARLRALPGDLRRTLAALVAWLRTIPNWMRSRRRDDGPAAEPADGGRSVPSATGDPTTLRERWRTFARWVVPDRWRRRTPAEVVRAATAAGYPRAAATDLATAFREVEYGGASPTAAREQRANEAFATLDAHRRAEGIADATAEVPAR